MDVCGCPAPAAVAQESDEQSQGGWADRSGKGCGTGDFAIEVESIG